MKYIVDWEKLSVKEKNFIVKKIKTIEYGVGKTIKISDPFKLALLKKLNHINSKISK